MAVRGRRAPNPGLLAGIDAAARGAMPAGLAVLSMVLAAAVIGMPGAVAAVALPAVFFWSVFRPAAMPPPAVFGLGLLQDLLTAVPLGSGVFVLLIVHGFAFRWRGVLARQSFFLVWLAFCGFAACAGALAWGLQALLGWKLPPTQPGLWQVLLTCGLYPLLGWPLGRLQTNLIDAENAA